MMAHETGRRKLLNPERIIAWVTTCGLIGAALLNLQKVKAAPAKIEGLESRVGNFEKETSNRFVSTEKYIAIHCAQQAQKEVDIDKQLDKIDKKLDRLIERK
jgi:hypothetical protein